MKCSKCGKRFNSLPAMAKHYRKKHPAAMKRKRKLTTKSLDAQERNIKRVAAHVRFCPHCGGFLG